MQPWPRQLCAKSKRSVKYYSYLCERILSRAIVTVLGVAVLSPYEFFFTKPRKDVGEIPPLRQRRRASKRANSRFQTARRDFSPAAVNYEVFDSGAHSTNSANVNKLRRSKVFKVRPDVSHVFESRRNFRRCRGGAGDKIKRLFRREARVDILGALSALSARRFTSLRLRKTLARARSRTTSGRAAGRRRRSKLVDASRHHRRLVPIATPVPTLYILGGISSHPPSSPYTPAFRQPRAARVAWLSRQKPALPAEFSRRHA